jgi:hypothetical protein
MPTATVSPTDYYATPGPFTDLGAHAAQVATLPQALLDLCHIVQGLIVHPFLARLYDLDPAALRQDELQIRRASEMVDAMLARDPRPLTEARPSERRFVGNCRHFTVLLCAFLRARGVPVRARCGFGAYFNPGTFEDHWVAEVWDHAGARWRLVDAQLDARQREAMNIHFDPLDVPRDQFQVAGDAWQRCRSGSADPRRFGILDMRGLWFVRGNVIRDLAAFAKRELLPWDGWGPMSPQDPTDADEIALLDRVAALTVAGDHKAAISVYRNDACLRVPRTIISFGPGGNAVVDLGEGVAEG